MAEQNNGFLTAKPTEGGEFSILEASVYNAVCVGVTSRNFKKYQSEDLEPKFQFVFQINDGGKNHYVRTLPLRNVISDKSNLFVFLNSWTGITLDKLSEGFDLSKLVGYPAQLVIQEDEREGKRFNSIANILKAKKNSAATFVEDSKAPAYLKSNLLLEKWIDGLSFAETTETATTATHDESKEAPAEGGDILETGDDVDLPF